MLLQSTVAFVWLIFRVETGKDAKVRNIIKCNLIASQKGRCCVGLDHFGPLFNNSFMLSKLNRLLLFVSSVVVASLSEDVLALRLAAVCLFSRLSIAELII